MNKEKLIKILSKTYMALDKFVYFIPGIENIYIVID